MFRITANWCAKYQPDGRQKKYHDENIRVTVNRSGLVRLDFYFREHEQQYFRALGKYHGKPTKEFLVEANDEYARLSRALLFGAKAFWEDETGKAIDKAQPRPGPDDLIALKATPLPPELKAMAEGEKFSAIVKEYCDSFEAKGKVSYENERALVKKLVKGVGRAKGLGDLLPSDITAPQVQSILDALSDRPTTANAVKKLTSRLWRWMKRRGYVTNKEAVEDLDADAPRPRDRLITESELRVLVKGCHPYFLAVVRNPMRLIEHTRVNWDQIDEDNNVTVRVKGGRNHVQPLTEAYLACGRNTRDQGGNLFTGRHGKWTILRTSLSDLCNNWIRDNEVHNATAHDLRKSFASWHERQGTSRDIWDACLAHHKPGLFGVYGLYDFLPEKREAIEAWDEFITSMNPTTVG